MRRPDVLQEHSRPSQTDIVRGQNLEPVTDPHANVSKHVSQLSHESNLNDIFVKRVSEGVKELKRIKESSRDYFSTYIDENNEKMISPDLTYADKAAIVSNGAVKGALMTGVEISDMIMTSSTEGKQPDYNIFRGKFGSFDRKSDPDQTENSD
jgi:hypothetical protein